LLRRRAVDLIGQDDRVENRAGVKAELARLRIEDRHAEHIGGKEVARKLDSRVLEPKRGGQRLGERRFADARNVLDQEVAARQKACEREPQGLALADDDAVELGQDRGEAFGDRNIGLA
jgi:hypothetical protein